MQYRYCGTYTKPQYKIILKNVKSFVISLIYTNL